MIGVGKSVKKSLYKKSKVQHELLLANHPQSPKFDFADVFFLLIVTRIFRTLMKDQQIITLQP